MIDNSIAKPYSLLYRYFGDAAVESCLKTWQVAASFAVRAKAVFFTLAYPCSAFMVDKGKVGAIRPCWLHVYQFSTPCPLSAPYRRGKRKRALERLTCKGNFMTTLSLRAPVLSANNPIQSKFSGFAHWQAETLPDIETLLLQVRRARGYLDKRRVIREQHQRDYAMFGAILAAVRAQIAIDKHNRVVSHFPLAAVWYARIQSENRPFADDVFRPFGSFQKPLQYREPKFQAQKQPEIVFSLIDVRPILRSNRYG